MHELKALIFDVDGTLADSERDGHRVAFNEAFSQAGLDWHWSEALYGELLEVTGGKERMRYYLQRFRPPGESEAVDDGRIADLHAAKTEIYTRLLCRGRIPLRPGVARLLAESHAAGMRLAVATTTSLPNVTALLDHCLPSEALSWIDVIAAGDVVAAKKPSPDIYHYALRGLGLTAHSCLAFEDSAHGLRAARGAGLLTIVTVNDYTKDQALDGAALVLDGLGEPDSPFTVLSGDAGRATYVDVALVRRLHGARRD